jgi:hypothetical protein
VQREVIALYGRNLLRSDLKKFPRVSPHVERIQNEHALGAHRAQAEREQESADASADIQKAHLLGQRVVGFQVFDERAAETVVAE